MSQTIRPGIHWVGVVEWTLTHFHNHELSIHRGTSYNAYLVVDEKIALIDTVKATHSEEMLKKVEALVPLDKIDYFVVNHCEPDHSGTLPRFLEKNSRAEIVCSKGGQTSVSRHFPKVKNPLKVVKTGDSFSLGKRSLRFFEAQMLHWPDTMFTYVPEEKLIFTNDAFGQHYASSSLYVDEADQAEVWQEAIKYFANILTPYSTSITRKIGEFAALQWPVETICPSHGLIWRKDPAQIIEKYAEWAKGPNAPSVVVLYDSIWGGTGRMARAITRGLEVEGMSFRLYSAGNADLNDVMTEFLNAKGLIVGCPTLNNHLMPSLGTYLAELRGLRFQNKIGAAFGTYGWSGEGVKRIEEALGQALVKVVQPGIKSQFSPTDEDLAACEAFGRDFAKAVRTSLAPATV